MATTPERLNRRDELEEEETKESEGRVEAQEAAISVWPQVKLLLEQLRPLPRRS